MKHFHEFYARFFSDDDETDTVDGSTSQKIRQKKENNSSVAAKSATPPSFKESRFFHGNRYIRNPPRFFDHVGHQTTNASIGNKHFFTK